MGVAGRMRAVSTARVDVWVHDMGCIVWCRVEGVADVGSYGSDLSGGSVGTACGRDWLVPGIASLVAGARASWGALRVV